MMSDFVITLGCGSVLVGLVLVAMWLIGRLEGAADA